MPRRKKIDDQNDPANHAKCGWCLTNHHQSCRPSVTWYDRTWYCPCDCKKKKERV